MKAGNTYVFDVSQMNGSHPLRFSTEDFTDYDYGRREQTGAPIFYTRDVTIDIGENGQEKTVTIVVDENTPDLFYICKFHPNMGKEATVRSQDHWTMRRRPLIRSKFRQ